MKLAADQDRLFARVANLLKKYDGSPEHRSAFRGLLELGASEGLTPEEMELIEEALALVGQSLGPDHAASGEIFEKWLAWQFEGVSPPERLAKTVFHRLPLSEVEKGVWERLLLGDVPTWLSGAILSRRLLTVKQLLALAKAYPAEFFRSPALDAMLARGSACPETVWEECATALERPEGLLQNHEVLLRCLGRDRRQSAVVRFLEILARAPHLRERALRQLLSDRGVSSRVLNILLFPPATGKSKEKKLEREQHRAILVEWVSVAGGIVQGGNEPGLEVGSLVVAGAVVSALGLSPALAKTLGPEMLEELRRVSHRVLVASLRRWEERHQNLSQIAIGTEAGDLYRAMHEHIGSLPRTQERLDDSPERSARYERFMGRREVLEEVLAALDEEPGESPLRDAIEVALFNSGVRDLAEVGGQAHFDSTVHHASRGGILPGDPVKVLTPGRCIGEGRERLILRRADVELVE